MLEQTLRLGLPFQIPSMHGHPHLGRGGAGAVPAFARLLWGVLGWRLLPAVALPVALGLTEGAALLLLLPMLQRLGIDVQQGGAGRIAAAVERGFEALGIPMTLEAVLMAVLVLSSAHALLSARQLMLLPALDRTMLRHYRQRLYEAFLRSEWALAARGRVSDRVHAVMTDVERITALTYQALNLTAGVVLFVVYLAVALRVSAALTALVMLCGFWLLVVQRRGGRESSEASRRYAETSAALHHMVSESLAGLKTVKSYGSEGRTAARAREVDHRLSSTYLAAMRGFARAKLRFDLGSTMALVFVLYAAIRLLRLPAASLLLILVLFARLLPRVATLQAAWQQFQAALPGFSRALALLEAHEGHPETAGIGQAVAPLAREIRFDGVWFTYEEGADPALSELTLAIRAGATTAVVGPSGAGKSTLADLLMGLLRPTAGRVLVDGAALGAEHVVGWRRRIGYVAQDTVLFNDTVRANLLWAVPDATESAMREALEAAAATFVLEWPAGLATEIGDRGARLSGGERQRLALARALLRQPDVLLLDEATSALDSEHERRIQDAIERLHGRVTIVVITHRLTTVRAADVIHVLDGGRLVESGTWDTLVCDPTGRFHQLCAAQHVLPLSVAASPIG